MNSSLKIKIADLKSSLKQYGKAAVAFSGGVDSGFLTKTLQDALGEGALALTADTPFMSRVEISEAKKLADEIGVRHKTIKIETIDDSILSNPSDRCYHCKTLIFSKLREICRAEGIDHLLDGSNIDDLSDFRPGIKALKELRVNSPLVKAGFSKSDIRQAAAELGLSNWNKPSLACLASRIPFGQRIEGLNLRMIEKAELYLAEKGIRQLRVRVHQNLARIEVSPEEREKFFDSAFMDEVFKRFNKIGFKYVALDMEGYKTGKLNPSTTEKIQN